MSGAGGLPPSPEAGLTATDWDGFGTGLYIDRNSTASVDRLVVSGDGRGIYVGRGSSFSGGWKDEDDTTLPTYMIEINDNKKWGLEVQKNSNVDLNNIEISGNGKEVYNNDDGSTWYEECSSKSEDSSTRQYSRCESSTTTGGVP